MKGKLNSFQKTMLSWNDLQAYNVVNAVKVPLKLDEQRIKTLIMDELTINGLTNLKIDRKHGTYEYMGGPAEIYINFISGNAKDNHDIEQIIEEEFSKRFDCSCTFVPFRFTVINNIDHFILIVAYLHAISGGDSIWLLVSDIIKKYQPGRHNSVSEPSIRIEPGIAKNSSFLKSIVQHCGFSSFMNFCSDISLRRSFKIKYADLADYDAGCKWLTIQPHEFKTLVSTSKKWGVTVNDLFVSMMLKAISPHTAARFGEKRRRKLSVAGIASLRRELNLDDPRLMGIFLGLFVVSHEAPATQGLRELALDINSQTKLIKRSKIFLLTPLKFFISRLFYSFDRRHKFYPKYQPVCMGVSNINITSIWKQTDNDTQTDFMAAVSTGPATPLVAAFTTLENKICVGLSYRKTVFTADEIEMVVDEFKKLVKGLEELS